MTLLTTATSFIFFEIRWRNIIGNANHTAPRPVLPTAVRETLRGTEILTGTLPGSGYVSTGAENGTPRVIRCHKERYGNGARYRSGHCPGLLANRLEAVWPQSMPRPIRVREGSVFTAGGRCRSCSVSGTHSYVFVPNFKDAARNLHFSWGILEYVAAPVAMTAFWTAYYCTCLKTRPLVQTNDPHLAEILEPIMSMHNDNGNKSPCCCVPGSAYC